MHHQTNQEHHTEETAPQEPQKKTFTLKIPRPNTQTVVLGIVALITVFQTVQLVRLNKQAQAAAAVQIVPSGGSDAVNPNAPESMVGGC